LENHIPVDTVAARIADLPTRTRVLERLNLTKVQDELQRLSDKRVRWSKFYGRNHPKMAELDETIGTLERELAGFPLDDPDQVGRQAGASPAEIVLAAFETESSRLEQSELDLTQKIDGQQKRQKRQQELELQLGGARQELAHLQNACERSRKELTAARYVHPELETLVRSAPALVGEPMGTRTGLPMAVCCVAGMALYMTLLWQIRRKWFPTGRTAAGAAARPPAAPRNERYRSQEEEQLLRLKLAVRG
jgi:hypothetical protein